MPKLAAVRKVGVPVPTNLPLDVTHLAVYYGPKGFTPSYDQPARLTNLLSEVPRTTKNNVEYFVFDSADLPVTGDGDYDLYFTLLDISDGEESSFNAVVTVPLDRDPPPTLGAGVLLD